MKILVLCLPGIGDALMATPMIKVLRAEFPKAKIDVGCMFSGVQYLFRHNPSVNSAYYLPLYRHSTIKGVLSLLPFRSKKYDISILAYPSFRREYHIVSWILGAKKRISHKFSQGYWSEFNFLDTDHVEVDEDVHILINNMNLLSKLGVDWKKKHKPNDFVYDLTLDKKDSEFGKQYIKKLGWKGHIIGLHPGSINSRVGMMKRWPIEEFVDLTKDLIKKKKKVLVFVGPDELDLGKKLVSQINSKSVHLIENLKLNQALGVLKQVDLLVTNDNGFAHLSNALKVKSIVLFGPTNPLWCSPYNKKISKVVRKAKFKPWFRNDIKVDHPPEGAVSGMDKIKVSDVMSALESF
jgi:heptosyltransferase-2